MQTYGIYLRKIIFSPILMLFIACQGSMQNPSPESVEIISCKSTFNSLGIDVQYFDPENYKINTNFKGIHTAFHKQKYSRIIYFGDSYTDLNSASISDVIFATDKLQKYYDKEGVDHFPFENYFEVLHIFKEQNLAKL